MMQYDPVPPEGCTCASFWTVRGKHKVDCPLSPADDELELRDWLIAMVKEATGGKIPISDAIEIAARALAWHQRKLAAQKNYESVVTENVMQVSRAPMPGNWEEPSTGKNIYNEAWLEAEVAKVKLGIRQQLGSLLPQNYAKAKPDIEKGIKSVIESIDRQLKENNPNG